MRYFKNSVQLNPERDIPILETTLRAGCISTGQLLHLMQIEYRERNQKDFNWRIRRLLRFDLLRLRSMPVIGRERILEIGETGLDVLCSRGELYTTRSGRDQTTNSTTHNLEINDLYLEMRRSGTLLSWEWATQIASRNDWSDAPYAKDYDAVIMSLVGQQVIKFGYEHERTLKTLERYTEIDMTLRQDSELRWFLYTVPNRHYRNRLARQFRFDSKIVCIAVYSDFCRQLFESTVQIAGTSEFRTLSSIIAQLTK